MNLRRILWFVAAVLVVAAVMVICGGLLLGLIALQEQLKWQQVPEAAAIAWGILLGVLIVGFVWVAVWRFARRLGTSSPGSWDLFGSTPAVRLVALGVVSLIYPRAVYWTIAAPILALIQLFTDFPQALNRVWGGAREGTSSLVTVDQHAARLAFLVQTLGAEMGRILRSVLEAVPVVEVVSALALWVLVGQTLSVVPGGDATQTGPIRILTYLRGLSDRQSYALWLGGVFFVGVYLSIAAIVAIPWLQEDKVPQNLTRDNLQKALNSLAPGAEDFERNFPATLGEGRDPFTGLVTSISMLRRQGESSGPRPERSAPTFVGEQLDFLLGRLRTTRGERIDAWKELREDVRQKHAQVVAAALTAFETELLLPMSTRERASFFRDIQRSVSEDVLEMYGVLRECMRLIADGDKQIESFTREVEVRIPRVTAAEGGREARWLDGTDGIPRLQPCAAVSTPRLVHATPEPGLGWGPFGAWRAGCCGRSRTPSR